MEATLPGRCGLKAGRDHLDLRCAQRQAEHRDLQTGGYEGAATRGQTAVEMVGGHPGVGGQVITLSVIAMGTMMAPKIQAQPFPLSAVRVLRGPFADATKACATYLLEVNPDRLLHNFRKHAGLEPKGQIYGGWENSGLAGHTLGHYLTACSQQYAATGDERYKAKVDYV